MAILGVGGVFLTFQFTSSSDLTILLLFVSAPWTVLAHQLSRL